MQSSAGLSKIAETAASTPAAEVRFRQPGKRRSTPAHFRLAIVLCEIIADLLTITLAVTLGYFIYDSLRLGKHLYYPTSTVTFLAFVFAIGMVLMLDRVGAYRRGNSLLRVRETEQVLRVSSQAFLIALAVSFFTEHSFFPLVVGSVPGFGSVVAVRAEEPYLSAAAVSAFPRLWQRKRSDLRFGLHREAGIFRAAAVSQAGPGTLGVCR